MATDSNIDSAQSSEYKMESFPEPNTIPAGWDVSAIYGPEFDQSPQPSGRARGYLRTVETIYDDFEDS